METPAPEDPDRTIDANEPPTGEETAPYRHVPDPAGLPEAIGRFLPRAVLGRGTFGTVYRAWDPQLHREVALKVPRDAGAGAGGADRFLDEARAASHLKHPGIVAIYEAGRVGDAVYIASEFVAGVTLLDQRRAGDLSPREAARVVRDLAVAVAYAHSEGVIHRDLKPANVMLAGGGRPQVMDFGLARRTDASPDGADATATLDGAIVGSPAYMAPEQARGKAATPASDQYALGVILYELLAGRRPFSGTVAEVLWSVSQGREPPPPRALRPGVPRDLDAICRKAMEPWAVRRYESAEELAFDLTRWLGGHPVAARPLGLGERLAHRARRHPATAVASALALVAMAGVAAALGRVSREQARYAEYQRAVAADNRRAAAELKVERGTIEEERRAVISLGSDAAREAGLRRVDSGAIAQGMYDLLAAVRDAEDLGDAERRRALQADLLAASRRVVPLRCVIDALGGDRQAGAQGVGRLAPDGGRALVIEHPERGGERGRLVDTRTGGPVGAWLPEWDDGAFAADGRTVVLAHNGRARLFDAATGEPLGPWLPRAEPRAAVVALEGGRLLARPEEDGPARIVDARTGLPVAGFEHPGRADAYAFGADGRRVATVGSAGPGAPGEHPASCALRLWDAADGRPVGDPLPIGALRTEIRGFAFSRDGATLLLLAGGLRAWDVRAWEPLDGPLPPVLAGTDDGRLVREDAPPILADALARLAARRPSSGQPRSRDAMRIESTITRHHGGWEQARAAAAFAHDGRTLFLSRGATVGVYDLESGGAVEWPTRHHGPITGIALDPAGKVLLTGGDDGIALAWEVATGRPLAAPLRHPGPVVSVGFLPDGRTAFAGSGAGSLLRTFLWDVESGLAACPPLEGGFPLAADAADDLLMTDCHRVWDLSSALPAARLPGDASALALSPDGGTLLVAAGGQLRRFRPAGGREVAAPVAVGDVAALAYRPDGKEVLAAVGTAVLRLDPDTLRPAAAPLARRTPVRAVGWADEGRVILAAAHRGGYVGQGPGVSFWDAETGRSLLPDLDLDGVSALRGDGAGRALWTCSGDGTLLRTGLELLDWAGGVRTVTRPAPDREDRGLFRTDGGAWLGSDRRLHDLTAPGLPPRTIRFADRDADANREYGARPDVGRDAGGPFWTPDGRTIVFVASGQVIRIDAATGEEAGTRLNLEDEYRSDDPVRNGLVLAALAPDGRTILTLDGGRTVRRRDLATGESVGKPFRIATPLQREEFERIAAFSPDGRRVLLAADAGSDKAPGVRLWDLAAGEPAGPVFRHPDPDRSLGLIGVRCAAFRPDGLAVATGGNDETVRIWDPATGRQIGPTLRHAGQSSETVVEVAFRPDGRRLLTKTEGGVVRLWDAESGRTLGAPARTRGVASYLTKPVAFTAEGVPFLEGPIALLPGPAPPAALPGDQPYPAARPDGRRLCDALSPDGRLLLTGYDDGTAWVEDAATRRPIGPPLPLGGPVRAVAFSDDGATLLTAADRVVRRWPTPASFPVDHDGIRLWLEARTGWRLTWSGYGDLLAFRKSLRDRPAAERLSFRRQAPEYQFLRGPDWARRGERPAGP